MEIIKNKAEINESFKSMDEDLVLWGKKNNDKLLAKLSTRKTTKNDGKCPNQYDRRWKIYISQSIPMKSGEVS